MNLKSWLSLFFGHFSVTDQKKLSQFSQNI